MDKRPLDDVRWPYISGFFDGDGSIEIDHRTNNIVVVRVKWFQQKKNDYVLRSINQFLRWHDPWINGKFYDTHKDGCSRVVIYSKDHSKLALELMMPHLIVKAPKARRALTLLGSEVKYRVEPVEWEYLAGFTDSDGHINSFSQLGYQQYRIGWTQSEEESLVLDEIKDFLLGQGINVTESEFDPSKYPNGINKGKGKTVRQIKASQKYTKYILQKMYPWLVVNKEKAHKAILYLQEVEDMKKLHGRNYRKNRGEVHV